MRLDKALVTDESQGRKALKSAKSSKTARTEEETGKAPVLEEKG